MRPLEMQAEKAGHAPVGGLDAGADGRRRDLRRVGDQRRQERRRAELRMRLADRLDALERGPVVEHDAAAAIDLQVDEAGRQHAGARLRDLGGIGRLVAFHDRLDQPVAHHQHGVAQPELAVEDPGCREGETVAHSVSVTLRRFGGWSGLSPSRTAKASTKE